MAEIYIYIYLGRIFKGLHYAKIFNKFRIVKKSLKPTKDLKNKLQNYIQNGKCLI